MDKPPSDRYDANACTSKQRYPNQNDWQIVNPRNNNKKFSFNRRIEPLTAKTPQRNWAEERLDKTKPSKLTEEELRRMRLQHQSDSVKNQRSKAVYEHRQILNNSITSSISSNEELNGSKATTISSLKNKMVAAGINFLNNFKSNNEGIARSPRPQLNDEFDSYILNYDEPEHIQKLGSENNLIRNANEDVTVITNNQDNKVGKEYNRVTKKLTKKDDQQPSFCIRFKGNNLSDFTGFNTLINEIKKHKPNSQIQQANIAKINNEFILFISTKNKESFENLSSEWPSNAFKSGIELIKNNLKYYVAIRGVSRKNDLSFSEDLVQLQEEYGLSNIIRILDPKN